MSVTLSIIYLIATVTFVIGLKLLGHPETAKRGNLIAASGMGIAILGTIFLNDLEVPMFIYYLIGAAILTGSIIGGLIAVSLKNNDHYCRNCNRQYYFFRKYDRLGEIKWNDVERYQIAKI